jgi:radical SAM-linked protein
VTEPDLRPAQRPAVQHLVVRYAKRGKMRFASHRDVARVFERGVRRAGLPIAYSAGFTPHPKISYAGGAPTGVASEAEYLSLALTSRQAAAQVCRRLNAALPDGIDVIDVTDQGNTGGRGALPFSGGPGGSSPQSDMASEWRVVLPGVEPATAERAVASFLALSEAPVERLTDKGVRQLDARAAVLEMHVLCFPGGTTPRDPPGLGGKPFPPNPLGPPILGGSLPPQAPPAPGEREASPSSRTPAAPRSDGDQLAAVTGLGDCAILRMVVLHMAPAVRPEDVLTALREQHGLVPSSPPMTTRLAQGPRALLAGTDVS